MIKTLFSHYKGYDSSVDNVTGYEAGRPGDEIFYSQSRP